MIFVVVFIFIVYISDNAELHAESVVQRYSVKNVFLKVSQNSQENTCVRVSFLMMLQASGLQSY